MFGDVKESQITNAIVSNFCEDMKEFACTDVIIIGAGPSGLMGQVDLWRERSLQVKESKL